MPEALAEFLDEISLHIEREISKVPAPIAKALLRDDSPFSTAEVLRILAHPEKATDLLDANSRNVSAAEAKSSEMSAV
jgi:hypothetical protein